MSLNACHCLVGSSQDWAAACQAVSPMQPAGNIHVKVLVAAQWHGSLAQQQLLQGTERHVELGLMLWSATLSEMSCLCVTAVHSTICSDSERLAAAWQSFHLFVLWQKRTVRCYTLTVAGVEKQLSMQTVVKHHTRMQLSCQTR